MIAVIDRQPRGRPVELVTVPFALADVAARDEVRVSHRAAHLVRGLELDEEVVVHCADGEFLRATVVGFEFELDDTGYLLELGVRLPPPEVEVLIGGQPDEADRYRPISVQDVVDLIGELRPPPHPQDSGP